jgi:Tetratricopeptide repeat
MAPGTEVRVAGYGVIDDPGRTSRALTTIGRWTGLAMWEDAMPVGRMTAEALMPGMSGAPVIRQSDAAVAGVVSGRYNTADGWLAGTVWVARTEDLLPLLDGIVDVGFRQPPVAGAVDVLLRVTAAEVELTGAGLSVRAGHGGVRPGLAEAVRDSRRARARAGLAARAQAAVALSYGQLGMLAQGRGDYAEAARQYQRSLDIDERLGNQAGIATSYSQIGSLVAERGGPVAEIVSWHIRALAIRLRIGVPQAVNNLRRLLPYRRELGAEPFAALLAQITDDAELVEAIPGLLDQVDAAEGDTT